MKVKDLEALCRRFDPDAELKFILGNSEYHFDLGEPEVSGPVHGADITFSLGELDGFDDILDMSKNLSDALREFGAR